jgi:type II secretory pathway component PulK
MSSRASVLIVVLWSLCLLAVFAVILGQTVRQKLALVGRIEERTKLHYIAEAGAKKAIAQLRTQEQKGYDSFGDSWADNSAIFADINVGDGDACVSYDYFDDLSKAWQTKYGLVDEERKINLNLAAQDVLERLFRIVLAMDETHAQELAFAVIDWRDEDSVSFSPSDSTEDFYYTGLAYPYEAKDAKFEVFEELLLLKGMNERMLQVLKDYVTVYGNGKVNINTASYSVLVALGLSDDIAKMIIAFRCGEDGEAGTADDSVFDANANIVPLLSQAFRMNASQVASLSNIAAGSLTTSSSNFTVKSKAKLFNSRAAYEVTCVVNREGKIFYWQENYN